MNRSSSRAWRKVRAFVLTRDSGRCQVPMGPDGRSVCGAPATDAGHIIAAAYGGTDHPDNLRAECEPHSAAGGAYIAQTIAQNRTTA